MDAADNPQAIEPHEKKKQLTESERFTIVIQYLRYTFGGTRKMVHGMMAQLSHLYNRSPQHIRRLAQSVLEQLDAGILYPVLETLRDIPRGPESQLDEHLAACLYEFNSVEGYMLSIRDFATKFNENYMTNFCSTTMQKYSKLLNVRFGKSYVKPLLKLIHKINRLQFILNDMVPVGNGD